MGDVLSCLIISLAEYEILIATELITDLRIDAFLLWCYRHLYRIESHSNHSQICPRCDAMMSPMLLSIANWYFYHLMIAPDLLDAYIKSLPPCSSSDNITPCYLLIINVATNRCPTFLSHLFHAIILFEIFKIVVEMQRPRARTGFTRIITDDRGHMSMGVKKSNENAWGNFVNTWDLPVRPSVPGNHVDNTMGRTRNHISLLKREETDYNLQLRAAAVLPLKVVYWPLGCSDCQFSLGCRKNRESSTRRLTIRNSGRSTRRGSGRAMKARTKRTRIRQILSKVPMIRNRTTFVRHWNVRDSVGIVGPGQGNRHWWNLFNLL